MEIPKRYNSVTVKIIARCLYQPPYFRVRTIRWCHLNFSPADPRCYDNEFWDKIDYNWASAKDNCTLFSPTPYFRARVNFVAMATEVGQRKLRLAAFDGASTYTTCKCKNLAQISYRSRVIANFVPNFVAMSTGVDRRKMRLAAFDGPSS